MRPGFVGVLLDFRNILCVCPNCKDISHLTDMAISYHAKPRRTILDNLSDEEASLQRAEGRFEEQRERIREAARERGRRQLPRLLRKAEPIFSRRGYFPQDAKALFDPVDFVIFDGMKRKDRVKRVVLFDGPPDSRERGKLQRSVERTIRAGNYEWRTVRVGKDGKIRKD